MRFCFLACFGTLTQGQKEFSKVKTEQASELVLKQISERLELSQSAQDYLNKKLATDMSMKRFNTQYCENNELNVYFYGDDLRQICKFISQVKK